MLVSLLLFFAVLISGCCGGRYRISSLWISYCLVLWTSRLSPRRRSIPAGHVLWFHVLPHSFCTLD
ncbi:Uncharacterized protein APZ42_005404 [Daphnia magna]|uniref:Secreted protein n=1 Tax=Daphnia magna TaxID=35525 RepID=A0A164GGW3_9CRUS|nr:Uncharacterized protein APZ42_005404 [Daphnia magna]